MYAISIAAGEFQIFQRKLESLVTSLSPSSDAKLCGCVVDREFSPVTFLYNASNLTPIRSGFRAGNEEGLGSKVCRVIWGKGELYIKVLWCKDPV
jgi:hypothetical protein